MKKKNRINSCKKGKHVERLATKLLKSLGYDVERNARNGKSTADLDLSKDPLLSRIHIEVKGNRQMDIEGAFRDKTFAQAERDAAGKPCVILWKKNFRPWVATWKERGMVLHSTDIKEAIERIGAE